VVTSVFIAAVSLALFWMAAFTLWWQMHAWRTPETLASTSFDRPDGGRAGSFSLLLPARHEQAVLEQTIKRLLESSHSDFEIIVIVGHDDPGTAEVAERAAARDPGRVRVVVDTHEAKNKPKALNTALPYCTGEVVGVFDAEDQVHPELLTHVDHAFRSTGADVVQGGVQLINFNSSWYSLRNCLEYFFWFRSRLHLHAQKGFIPLGGNTVFVRTDVLRDAGGWDPHCLAEDCDLGVRLSSAGKKVVVAYDSDMVTREETPGTLMSLLKQRTRWNQGFLQVYRKKDWKQLPTRGQRMLARYTLMTPFLQAFTGVIIPLNVAIALFLDVSVAIAFVTLPAAGHRHGHLRLRGRRAPRLRQAVRVAHPSVALPQAHRRRSLLPGAPRRGGDPRRLPRASGTQRLGADQSLSARISSKTSERTSTRDLHPPPR